MPAEIMTGDALRQMRTAAGDTQKECAERLHTNLDRIKDYEQGVHELSAQQTHLVRLTYDPLYRAKWLVSLQRRSE